MRLFLALALPETLRASIARAIAPAHAAAPHVRWVREETLHLTMKFLGERPEADVPRIASAVGLAVADSPPFDATIGGAGAFPNFRRPRAVWLGMSPPAPFVALSERIDAAVSALGIAVEARPFHPHVTLGRVAAPLAVAEQAALETSLRAIRQRWPYRVGEVVLMRSALGAAGSTYTMLAAAPLEGR